MTTHSATTTSDAPSDSGLGMFATAFESARQTLIMLRYRRILWVAPIGLLLMFAFAFVLAGTTRSRSDGAHLFSVFAWWGRKKTTARRVSRHKNATRLRLPFVNTPLRFSWSS